MSKSIADREREREEFDHAVLRVGKLLIRSFPEEGGQRNVLNMITKNWNRESSTFAVQIFIVMFGDGVIVDISTEVATILRLRYSQCHRGVLVQAIGTNAHHHITDSLARVLWSGERSTDHLTYRSL